MNFKEAKECLKNNRNLEKVKDLLETASNNYYNSDELILTDSEYDELYKEYRKLTNEEIIGALPEGKGTINVEHSYKNLVGTLEKAFNIEEAIEWLKDVCDEDKYFEKFQCRYSLKYDGNSITIEYNKDGTVNKALTRGRGGKGKDLTYVFKDFSLDISKTDINEDFAIKYEAIITYENYDKICSIYDEEYANPRSMISGILGRDDAYKYAKYITLVPLKIKFISDTKKYDDMETYYFKKLFNSNFYTFYIKYSSSMNVDDLIEDLKSFYTNTGRNREKLPFMIDGVVIDVLNQSIQKDKGYNPDGSIPKFSIALKFPYLERRTKVKSIDFSYGDSGRITPVVYFEEVEFNGTKHNKQSISNYKRFKELNLGVDSEIMVSYHSDCLTYITKLNSEENKKIKPIEYISKCPICGSELKINDTKTFVSCINPSCKGRILGKLQNYFSKMDIKGIKVNTIEKLYNEGLVSSIQDMYTLDYNKVAQIEGLGEKSAEIIKNSINNKEYFDYEIIGSLMIPNISIENAKMLCRYYSIQEIIDIANENKKSKIIDVEGYSDINAGYLIEGIKDNIDTINFLVNRGCKIYKDTIQTNSDSLTIVFTGVRDKILQNKLESQGHRVTSSVSKKTNILVCFDTSSNSEKAKKAREYGAEIISYEEAKKRWL